HVVSDDADLSGLLGDEERVGAVGRPSEPGDGAQAGGEGRFAEVDVLRRAGEADRHRDEEQNDHGRDGDPPHKSLLYAWFPHMEKPYGYSRVELGSDGKKARNLKKPAL